MESKATNELVNVFMRGSQLPFFASNGLIIIVIILQSARSQAEEITKPIHPGLLL